MTKDRHHSVQRLGGGPRPTRGRRALVVGGGIGGPTAAMALLRAGVEPVVYEAVDAPAEYHGLFLNLASNGLDALRTLGVDVVGKADGFPAPRMVMWSGTGKRLGEVANGVRLDDGTVSVILKRALLQRALLEEAERRGVDVVLARTLSWRPLPDSYRGSAPTIHGLQGRWATDRYYAAKLARVGDAIDATR